MFADREILRRLSNIERQGDAILKQLGIVITKENTIMASIDDVLTDVTAESTQLDGINALISGIQAQLASALSGTTVPQAVQAKIDAVFAQLQNNDTKIAAALAANTPAAPAGPVVPAGQAATA